MTQASPVPTGEPRPAVSFEELGRDGNAFAIMGVAIRNLRGAGASREHIAKYQQEAMSGDYDNLLRVTATYLDIDGADSGWHPGEDQD